ncbi:hypothetical protein CsSME_00026455 [Camellia sinensis var. sinensis]
MRICAVNQDAKYLAYGLSSNGSDWITIKVMQVENKTIELDTVSWVKFSCASWTHDSKGFFYSQYPAPKCLSTPFCWLLLISVVLLSKLLLIGAILLSEYLVDSGNPQRPKLPI